MSLARVKAVIRAIGLAEMRDGVQRRSGWLGQLSFIIIMLALTALFVRLGLWQVERLEEKETLIAAVETRLTLDPIAFPDVATWSSLEVEDFSYLNATVVGTPDHGKTVQVFTNLTSPSGQYGRTGYWVLVPVETANGDIVWINRGFVPDAMAAEFADGGEAEAGETSYTGLIRLPEAANSFTPAPDLENRREWVRDPSRLSELVGLGDRAVAPVTIDLPAGPRGSLPQGGETQLSFPNRHIEYAGTWFIFAFITPIMLIFWVVRQRRTANLAQTDARD